MPMNVSLGGSPSTVASARNRNSRCNRGAPAKAGEQQARSTTSRISLLFKGEGIGGPLPRHPIILSLDRFSHYTRVLWVTPKGAGGNSVTVASAWTAGGGRLRF